MTVPTRRVSPLPWRAVLWAPAFLLVALMAAPSAAQRVPERPEQVFSDAYKLYADEFYEQAIVRFDAFRRAYPEHINAAEALYYQAEASLAAGHVEQAVTLFTQFRQRYPTHPLAFQASLALGQYFFESKRYARAIETLAAVLTDDPPPEIGARSLYWMGESSRHLGRIDQALRYYQQAADNYRYTETAPIALYAVALTHVEQNEYSEAAAAFERLGTRYPNSPYARNIGLALAEIYYELDEFDRVIEEIKQRRNALDPEAQDRATFLTAESYNQLRDSENAIYHYRQITEGDTLNLYFRRALYGLGWNYHHEGVYQWAADHFLQVHEGFDDDLAMQAVYYEAANRYLAQQHVEAIGLFEAVADEWPRSELADKALYEKGMIEYERRLWRDANDTFSRLLDAYRSSPLVGEALRQRGYTAIALNDFDAAYDDFDRAVALDAAPQALKDEVLFQKAWLLYRSDNFAAAAPAFSNLYQRDPGAPKAGESLFWAAESYYQLDQYDRATPLFRKYLSNFAGGPHVDAAHYALGWTYFKQKRYDEAIREFETFVRRYREDSGVPYLTDARLRLADSYYALKRYSEAVRYYQRAADAGEDYALYQIGQAFTNAGDDFEAISAFQELLDEQPDSEWREEARYTLGYLYFQNQDYDQAINEYQTLIRQYPNDPIAAKAQYGIGDALFNDERLEESVQAYTRVLERYPNSPFVGDAAAGIQYALIGLNDEARADRLIDDFANRFPNSPVVPELRFRQAEVKYQSGQLDEAVDGFRRYVRTYSNAPQLPDAYYYLGVIYAEQGRVADAESALNRVVTSYSQHVRSPDAARQLGRLLLDQDRHQDALDVYRRLGRMASGDAFLAAEANYGQGQALLGLGRTSEAETLLRDAVEAAPESSETAPAMLGLARVYEQQGRSGDALRYYRRVVSLSRDEAGAEALYHLGALLLREGEARSAVEELSRMPVLYSGFLNWLARGYLLQARAFRSLGQTGDASRLYDKVIQDFNGTPYANEAAREKASL